MLIPSPRHTPADLRLWADLEAGDTALAGSLDRKIDRAVADLRSFCRGGGCYASLSCGKDSMAVFGLLRLAGLCASVPLVHVHAAPVANPDNAAVLLAIAHPVEVVTVRYDPDAGEAEGDALFFAALRAAGRRYVSGVRGDESGGRRIRMRRHGVASANACAPLGWWTADEVFAFLARERLPVHPAYACLGGGRWDRRRLRVDELGGERGAQFGRREWEREYYGDALNRLATRQPRPGQ